MSGEDRKNAAPRRGQSGRVATEHGAAADLLPQYAAGTLDSSTRQRMDAHLVSCFECQADLVLWLDVADEEAEQAAALPRISQLVLEGALARLRDQRRQSPVTALRRAAALVRAQVLLLRHEVWLSSLLVMLLGYVVALLSGHGDRAASAIGALAPIVAAAGIALVYGPEVDPGLELALATPTSPRQVLLARLVVVFGYDLGLALAATVGLLPLVPVDLLGGIVVSWLGPMTFLSALALLLSLGLGAETAASISLGVWAVRWLAWGVGSGNAVGIDAGGLLRGVARAVDLGFGSSTALLAAGGALFLMAFWLVGRESGSRLGQAPS